MNNQIEAVLPQVIEVDEDKCVNCHACIAACPVKYCNDGSKESVTLNSDMCIACGHCMEACKHEARKFKDDFEQFINGAQNNEKIIVIVAPSVAASFPNTYLNLNGWLKELGVDFIYDVSFGAELTVKSYVEHIKKHNPKTVIAQPCPAIVSYIQLYKPELLNHLIPVDSPMMHAVKMIKKYYPEYKNHKVAVISPCLAKKREFNETGVGDYVVAMKSVNDYFERKNIDLEHFPPMEYDNPKAERAVLFSSPGGLLKTAERWLPGISDKSRKIEGVDTIYDYLEKLPQAIEKGISPLIVDCLNCENGCNGGPATLTKEKSLDEIEYAVSQRSQQYKEHYKKLNGQGNIEKIIDKYWDESTYQREYKNNWANVKLKYPNRDELKEIYEEMHKYSDDDLYNCVSCGYNSCEKMATAIFNGLNRPENCHYYLQKENDISREELKKSERKVHNILESAHDGFVQVDIDFTIQQANLAFKEMVKKNDVVGRSLFEFVDKDNKQILIEQRKLRESNKKSSYELELTQSDKDKILSLVSGAPLFDEEGKRIGSFAMFSDITELKKAEMELRKSHENLEHKVLERTEELQEMLEELRVSNEMVQEYNKDLEKLSIVASEIDNATIIMDPKGDFEWVNTGFTKMFGLTNDHVKGKNIISKSTPKNIKQQILDGIEYKRPIKYEFEQNGKEQSKWIQVNITPILNAEGQIKKLIAIDTDITALKQKEFEILNQKEEIESQRDSIEKQRDLAKMQTDHIQASINYASRIQNAVLPDKELFKKYFEEHFVIFYPKDIVSGDFYWLAERNNKVYVAAADCTGHGVPGAFMSMLGITFLNEIVNGQCDEGKDVEANMVLNRLKANIVTALNQTGKARESKDGLDIALCIFDKETREMQFSGAHLPVIILRDGKIIEIRGDRMPIGISFRAKDSFTNHFEQLQEGDQIYLFSDGITDQFNGVNKRKLTKKRFKELIQTFGSSPMKDQFLRFNTAFDVWQGNKKQVDDMLLIGLKF